MSCDDEIFCFFYMKTFFTLNYLMNHTFENVDVRITNSKFERIISVITMFMLKIIIVLQMTL